MTLEKLKRRLGLGDNSKDALLSDLLTDAEQYVIAYTGRASVPAVLSGVVVELAAMQYNRLGLEGESSHSEGGVSITVEGLPQSVRQLLNRCRLAKVVG